jgi:hypothetical protein
VAVDSAGNLYVADLGNNTIREITPAGVVTTLAGSAGAHGSADGTGSAARFSQPAGLTVDGAGNVYVADTSNDTIRKLSIPSVAAQSGLAGTGAVAIQATLSGLTTGTTVYFRAVATNGAGGTQGAILSFTTGASTPTPTASLVTITSVSTPKVTIGKTRTRVIDVQFSGQVTMASADDLGAYTLTTIPQGKTHTVKPVVLGRAVYSTSAETVTLFARKTPLSLRPPLILTINASDLVDTLGRDVDGTGDGQPGGLYKAMLSKAGAVRIRGARGPGR